MTQVTKLNGEESCPFVGESLRILRQEVGNASTVLGFVGAPFTLATYIIEGGSSKSFAHTKRMAFAEPEVRLGAACGRTGAAWARERAGAAAAGRGHGWAPRATRPPQRTRVRSPTRTSPPNTHTQVLHALLDKLADNVADYVRYQADAGAQAVQIFDSWASHLSPQDFDVFAGPYIRKVRGCACVHVSRRCWVGATPSGGVLGEWLRPVLAL